MRHRPLPIPRPSARSGVAGLLLACAALAAAAGAAPAQGGVQTDTAQGTQFIRAGGNTGPVLDAPVSRTGYLLGPGDVVDVSLFGDLNLLYNLPVSPEGSVVIPSVGVVRVLGLNLDQAEARVRTAVLRFYRNVEVNLNLAQVRRFKVFVLGAVPQPGARLASAATRVSELIPPENGRVRRNVLLRRGSGDSVRIDLARFTQTGDLSANPTLREGDALIVPTLDESVEVYGRVFFPGTYEYRRGESLAQLLSLANGGEDFPSNAADTVRVSRFVGPEQREFHVLSRAEATGARGQGFVLRPSDAIYVAEVANFRQQKTATITGQVVRPGTYPIRPDTTTVRELVALAGGFTPEASLTDATLRRAPRGRRAEGLRELQGVSPELLSSDEREILKVRTQGDETNVVIDFQRLFLEGRDAYDQRLQAGDLLTVPERRFDVVVLGAVRTPGAVSYAPGRSVSEYVALAGWFGRRADRGNVVVLKSRLGAPVEAEDAGPLDPGDTVIVPFRERRTFMDRITAVNAVAGALSGLVVTVFAVREIF